MNTDEGGTSLDGGQITFGIDREADAVQLDPVCGVEVIVAAAAPSEPYRGVDYYFCSSACKDKFVEDPSHYVG